MDLLILINPSLVYIYCNTTLPNYGLIRLNGFAGELVSIYTINFIINCPNIRRSELRCGGKQARPTRAPTKLCVAE
jgi:hypothetical protein